MTQKECILNYLKSGGTLTPMDALTRFRCFRLAARIVDIENDGTHVDHIPVRTDNGKTVMSYRLAGAQTRLPI